MWRSWKNIAILGIVEVFLVIIMMIVTNTFFPQYAISPYLTMGLAIFFFLIDGLTLLFSNRLLLHKSKRMVGFYLVAKVLRFMFSVAIVFLYLMAGGNHAIMFVIQLLLFYLVTLLFTNVSLVRSEAINKKKV